MSSFEERLGKDDGHLDITIWFDYLKSYSSSSENQNNNKSKKDLFILFERALRIFPQSVKLWNWYLDEVVTAVAVQNVTRNQKQHQSIYQLFDRAVSSFITTQGGGEPSLLLTIMMKWFDFSLLNCSNNSTQQQLETIIRKAQHHLHPQALAEFVRHCLIALCSSSSSMSIHVTITVELLTWLCDNNFGSAVVATSSSSSSKPFTVKTTVIYQTVLNVIEALLNSSSSNSLTRIAALYASLECLDRIVIMLHNHQTNYSSNQQQKQQELEATRITTLSRLLKTNKAFTSFLLQLVELMQKSLDELELDSHHHNQQQQQEKVTSLCKRFTDLLWLLQSEIGGSSGNGDTTSTSTTFHQQQLYCSCIASVVSCLCKNSGNFSLARSILGTGMQNAVDDEQVQTLYVCLLALNREAPSSSSSNKKKKMLNKNKKGNAQQAEYDEEEDDESNVLLSSLSQDALQREVVKYRTLRNPADPANWMELIALSMSSSEEEVQNENDDDGENATDEVVNDQLFQRAIRACTSEAALNLMKTRASNTKSSTTTTRPVHLFLAYAAWLEEQYYRKQQKQSQASSSSSSSCSYATIPVQLLKRAVASTYTDSTSSNTTHHHHVIASFHDRVILLQAAAECILRTSISSSSHDGIRTCIDFLKTVCEGGDEQQPPLIPLSLFSSSGNNASNNNNNNRNRQIFAPLWSMRVELLLAIGEIDEAVRVCWSGLRDGFVTMKLVLVVIDKLISRGIEIAENDGSSSSGYFEYSLMAFSQYYFSCGNKELPKTTLGYFEKASQLTHFALDLLLQQQQQTSSSSSSEVAHDTHQQATTTMMMNISTLYAIAFHLSLYLPTSKNTSSSSSSQSSSSNIDMLRQLHNTTIKTIRTTTSQQNQQNSSLLLMSRMYFSLGFVEWDRGLNGNALEAFRNFCLCELSLLPKTDNNNTTSSSTTTTSSTTDSVFSFVARRHAMVLLSSPDVSSSSSSSSSSHKTQQFIKLIESLMQKTTSVKQLLRFGMEMVMYLFAIVVQNNNNTKQQQQGIDSTSDVARVCLQSLAEVEDPRLDESGVWKLWQDYVVQQNDENGFLNYTRFKRNMIRKWEEKETTVVEMD